MKLDLSVLEKVQHAGKKIVLVTKYWDEIQTKALLQEVGSHPAFLALGENRIDQIKAKQIPRGNLHFIGRIQSRQIRDIVLHCSVVHSLDTLSHAEKLQQAVKDLGHEKLGVFLQINIANEPQKSGIVPEQVPGFIEQIQALKCLNIHGISALGLGVFTEDEKRAEFRHLLQLRDKYLPGGLVSAGTSRDYEMALEEGIDIVRVGKALEKI